MTQPAGTPDRRTPAGLKVLAVLGALVLVPGGAFLAAANVGTGGKVAIGAAVVWWLVASAAVGKTLLKRRPDLRTPVRAALAAAAVVSVVAAFVVTRGNTVDEQIATADPGAELVDGPERDAALAGGGRSSDRKAEDDEPAGRDGGESPGPGAGGAPARNVQLLSGAFTGESGHRGSGDAAVVKLGSGGRVLTFSNFDVDPGAGGLRVYLHAGPAKSDDLGEFLDLAGLKGNKGDQQYEIPDDVDLSRYTNVVIWCVPFTTRIAQAPLS